MVLLVTVLRDCVTVSFALSGLCLASSRLPAPFRVSVIVLVAPAGIVAVLEAIVIVFLIVLVFLVDAATAITLPPRIVSRTEAVSLILQEVPPVQLTRTLIVAPEVLMCLTVARPGTARDRRCCDRCGPAAARQVGAVARVVGGEGVGRGADGVNAIGQDATPVGTARVEGATAGGSRSWPEVGEAVKLTVPEGAGPPDWVSVTVAVHVVAVPALTERGEQASEVVRRRPRARLMPGLIDGGALFCGAARDRVQDRVRVDAGGGRGARTGRIERDLAPVVVHSDALGGGRARHPVHGGAVDRGRGRGARARRIERDHLQPALIDGGALGGGRAHHLVQREGVDRGGGRGARAGRVERDLLAR